MFWVNTVCHQKFKFCSELMQVVAEGDITLVVAMQTVHFMMCFIVYMCLRGVSSRCMASDVYMLN
jgi:hypothetical protein